MHGFLLQDWITIRGASVVVTQGADLWLDMTPYQDVQFWVDIRALTLGGATSITLGFETSPTRDDAVFKQMASASLTGSTTMGVQGVIPVLMATAAIPIARWLRWKLTPASPTTTWDVTFRVALAANSPGT